MKAGILLGQLKNTRNESAMIRTAETFGITHVYVVGGHDVVHGSVTRGADQHMSIHHVDTYREFIGRAYTHNHGIVVIEDTPDATPIGDGPDYPANPVFVTGNESKGVPAPVVEAADCTVSITQSPNGYMRCLNTAVAASIVMHDWFQTRLHRDHAQREFHPLTNTEA